MNIFRIVLGLILIASGLFLAAAGYALFFDGSLGAIFNVFMGFTLAFFGLGFIIAGSLILSGDRVRDALGGIVTARSGHSGVGLHKGDTHYVPPSNSKDILFDILKYTIIGIAVILIAIFSAFRVIGGFQP